MHVSKATTSRTRIALLSLGVGLMLLGLGISDATAKTKGLRHVFVISKIEIPTNAPPELESLVRKQLLKVMEAQPKLLAAIPDDAPAIDEKQKGLAGNKAFRKYMEKHDMRAYKVIVQVTSYEQSVEPNRKKPGKVIGSQIALRMFGETIPEHVMAFSGEGSATVLIEVGKKIRASDKKAADDEATELAINDAVNTSLKKLEEVPPKATKPPKKKSK